MYKSSVDFLLVSTVLVFEYTKYLGKLTTANMLHGTSGASIARGTFDITLFSVELAKYVSGVFMLQIGFSISCY